MSHAYTEDQLVEQPAIGLFAELGWTTVSALEETFGATGRPADCQRTILHLVSRVSVGIGLGKAWAVSDGNAGAFHTWFDSTLDAIKTLDWAAIRATDWRGKTHQKSAEFLVADFFPWTGIHAIGCHNSDVATNVQELLKSQHHRPAVTVESEWYY